MSILDSIISVILPSKRPTGKTTAISPTFRVTNPNQVLSRPGYTEHLTDPFVTRTADNSETLIREMMRHDPDMSSAVFSYLTVADTKMQVLVRTPEGEIDYEGIRLVERVLEVLGQRHDYKQGFQLRQNYHQINENMRYMILARGMIAAELVLEKDLSPRSIQLIDPSTLRWVESENGVYKPEQVVSGRNENLSLDIPTFFVSFFRRDPTQIYSYSPFVSSINTVVARQRVINDLYRIMNSTGYPRIKLTVLEDVLRNKAPESVRDDASLFNDWVSEQLNAVANDFANLRVDQPWATTDAVDTSIINDRKSGMETNISHVIATLNAQNQAALKTMSTILGRGESGVNTASTEARIFALNADQLNSPIAEMWSNLLTLAIRLNGNPGYVKVKFEPAELRPVTELEPMVAQRQSRLLIQLSLGTITDDEFHMMVNGRPRPLEAPLLSGTRFLHPDEEVPEVPQSKGNPLDNEVKVSNPNVVEDNKNK